MTEHLTHHEAGGEKLHLTELAKENLERAKSAAEQAEAHGAEHSIEHLQKAAQEQAISGREHTVGESEHTPASHTFGAHKELKADSYRRTLAHIRSKLNLTEKTFSKHIHNKKIEKIDNLAAATVARPWGILLGGACALIGTSIVLLFANHYGFRYNFGLFLVLFFGGYLTASLIEMTVRIFSKKS